MEEFPVISSESREVAERQATAAAKKPAFDHDRLAAAINAASGGHYTGLALPFAPAVSGRGGAGGRGGAAGPPQTSPLTFKNNEQAIEFGAGGSMYICQLTDYRCMKIGPIPTPAGGRGRGSAPEAEDEAGQPMPMEIGGDPVDGLEWQAFPQQDGGGGRNGHVEEQQPCATVREGQGRGRGGRGRGATATDAGVGSQILGQVPAAEKDVCSSFDGKWDAFIENYNVFLRPSGATAAPPPAPDGKEQGSTAPQAIPLSFDGSEGNYYTLRSIAWSPDSKHLVAYHTRPGYDREVHYIESSPADQIQPKHTTIHSRRDLSFPRLSAPWRPIRLWPNWGSSWSI